MKIRKIEFSNHPVFNDLKLDFTNSRGETVNTIIIAGENGVGKSQLLNAIFEFSNFNLSNTRRDEKRIYEIQLSDDEMQIFENEKVITPFIKNIDSEGVFSVTVDYNSPSTWEQIAIRGKNSISFTTPIPGSVINVSSIRQVFKCIYSDAEISFNSEAINSVTAKNIDAPNLYSERSSFNLATQITQLLIDIQSLDALDFSEWARNNLRGNIDPEKIDVRVKRFISAFDYMFSKKKYKKISNSENTKQIIFEENGKETNVNQLSSGEKQIVFRGSFLLKDRESSKGALILIDEPELSLHPKWQLKILSYFKKLFTTDLGVQTSQLIVTTHSPFIIHNSNRNDDKVIVLQRDENGLVTASQNPQFYSWSNEKFIQEAFDINHTISEIKPTAFLEGETDEQYYNKCVEVFGGIDFPIEFKWIGRINDKGNAENTGDTALNQARTFFIANPDHAKNKVVLFYDNDTNKPDETIGGLLVRKMSMNANNPTFKIGVENLLTLISEINVSDFYKEKIRRDDYGAESIIRELDKRKLCNFICNDLSAEKQKIVLGKIKEEIDRLHNEL